MADKTGYIGRNPADSSVKVARQTFTPTTATTDFTFSSGYTVGYLDLFLNGAKLIEGTDYNANNGSVISMVSDAQSGDVLEAVAYKAFNVGDSSASSTGNFSVGNDLTVSNNATISKDLNVVGYTTTGKGLNVTAGGINVVAGVSTFAGAVQANATTDSTTKDTGALIVDGGVGVEKNIVAGGDVRITGNTNAGIATFTGIVNAGSDVRITGNINAGIATFTSVAGDGSALTGVANTDVLHTREITVTGVTTATGAVNTGYVSVGSTVGAAGSIYLPDFKAVNFGDAPEGDLQIYHGGSSTSYIKHTNGSGSLKVYSEGATEFYVGTDDDQAIRMRSDGAIYYTELYADDTVKFNTTKQGTLTTGISSITSHCIPESDVGGDLGSTTNRWANIYTADMQLSNEGSQNDIDGTWGKYTIQEGETDLFLINRRTGKKYKFMLEEVQ